MAKIISFEAVRQIRSLTNMAAEFDAAMDEMRDAWLQLDDNLKASPSVQEEYNTQMHGLVTRRKVIDNMLSRLQELVK